MSKPGKRKLQLTSPRLVGVIASPDALARATRLRRLPDFFELRLDMLRDSLGEISRALPRLRAPLILTARHPAEGGDGSLGHSARRRLLEHFLAHAALIDLELRVVRQMGPLLARIRNEKRGLILSAHFLDRFPSPNELQNLLDLARAHRPDYLKIAARTDTREQLETLRDFFLASRSASLPLAVMGIGKVGLQSRRELARLGSALVYGSVAEAIIAGQPTLSRLRRGRPAYI